MTASAAVIGSRQVGELFLAEVTAQPSGVESTRSSRMSGSAPRWPYSFGHAVRDRPGQLAADQLARGAKDIA